MVATQLVAYLGAGHFTGKVSDLAYHNSLMVQIWSMLADGSNQKPLTFAGSNTQPNWSWK